VVNRVGDLVGIVLGGVSGKPIELEGHEELGPVYVTYITSAPFFLQRIERVFGRSVNVEQVDIAAIPGVIMGTGRHHENDLD